jgi:hypothetical protein
MNTSLRFLGWLIIISVAWLLIKFIGWFFSSSDESDYFIRQVEMLQDSGYTVYARAEINLDKPCVIRLRNDAWYYLMTDREVTVDYYWQDDLTSQERLVSGSPIRVDGMDKMAVYGLDSQITRLVYLKKWPR